MAHTIDHWRKSRFSGNNGACVELAPTSDGMIAVRDSKNPDGGMLTFSRAAWAAFLADTKTGQFDDLA